MSVQSTKEVYSCIEVYSIAKKLTDVVQHEIELALSRYNLTFKQWQVLNAISSSDASTPTKIANHICADKPSITRITDYLVTCSLLKRERGVDDRRTIQLKLTEEGMLAVSVGHSALQAVPIQFKSNLSPSEVKKVSMFEKYCSQYYGG